MNIQGIKSIKTAVIIFSVLSLLGFSAALTPAFAAGVDINGGMPVTNYPQVTLAFTPPAGAVQVSFKNEIDASWSGWLNLNTRQWTLSTDAGIKTVSVQFRDSLSATTAMPGKLSGTIKLDYSLDTSFHNTTFGTYGYQNLVVADTFFTAANAVAIDSAGRKVVVGTIDRGNGDTDLAVVRYLADGSGLDSSFNGNGKFTYGGPGADTGKAVVISDAGNIIVVGSIEQDGPGNTDILMLRLTTNGTLDGSFGNGGVVVYTGPGAGADSANAVAIQPADGKIVVAGTYANGATKADAIVLRFSGTTGALDTTFGSQSGALRTGAFIFGGPENDAANAVAIDAAGKIVVAGTYDHGAGDTSAWIFRLTTEGELDETFGAVDGLTRTGDIAFGDAGADSANAIAIQGTKIVVVGTYDWTGGDTDIWVQQLLADGTPDTSFNGTGSKTFGDKGADSGSAVVFQDTKIIVAGTYVNDSGNSFVWATRLNSDGSDDSTFNNGSNYTFGAEDIVGSDLIYGTASSIAGRAVALQADGRIVLAGIGNQSGFATTLLTLRIHGKTYPLTVTTLGSGTVAAFPGALTGGIGNFVPDSIIQLTATPVGGAAFNGWTGACTGTGVCSVTMDAAKNVTASFTMSYPLAVSVTGTGTVTSVPAGTISCNSTSGPGCSSSLLDGTIVTLTTSPRPWYTLSGFWSGACSGSITTDCVVTMSQSRTVSATFIPNLSARVVGYGDYPTLTEAYSVANASGAAATIQAKNILFPAMVFNLPVKATIQGGKGSDFSASPVGFTSISFPLRIRSGRLNVSNVKVTL